MQSLLDNAQRIIDPSKLALCRLGYFKEDTRVPRTGELNTRKLSALRPRKALDQRNGTRPSLLHPADMPVVSGLAVPRQFYIITTSPAPIAGMQWPSPSTPWSSINNLGFRHIICLGSLNPNYAPSPLRIAHAVDLDDLASGGAPRDPGREERAIRNAVQIAADKIRLREGVVIHCVGGTGRTGTVIGCLLRTLGYDGPEIVTYLNSLNKERHRRGRRRGPGWLESSWQAELVLRFRINF